MLSLASYLILSFLILQQVSVALLLQQPGVSFPGVHRDLATFCSSRPSLSIDLSPMIVHVKRNNSFNYKLYLFSGEHVFQTGQIVPRDNFRIHSFPVKFKTFNEFWPPNQVPTFIKSSNSANATPILVSSAKFNVRKFFKLVPLNPIDLPSRANQQAARRARANHRQQQQDSNSNHHKSSSLPLDVQGDILPGDKEHHSNSSSSSHSSTESIKRSESSNFNQHIQFDRDDQVSLLNGNQDDDQDEQIVGHRATAKHERALNGGDDDEQHGHANSVLFAAQNKLVLPVGSFSSFQVNLTYLVRKDFDQSESELIEIRIDPAEFQVKQVSLLQTSMMNSNNTDEHDDQHFKFLSHKLLRDPSTRIVSINQIYENWITRNFYTIVYIQRRLEPQQQHSSDELLPLEIVSDRLIFRGSSAVLLGAEQLDYQIKSSAFITEKNNLHYFLEFLTNGKFYLGAVDWSRRPFRFINWQKSTGGGGGDGQSASPSSHRTQFDNEELLLCPPAVCYSEQPVDELISYGRLPVSDEEQEFIRRRLAMNSQDFSREANATTTTARQQFETTKFYSTTAAGEPLEDIELIDHHHHSSSAANNEAVNLSSLTETIQKFASSQLEIRLHLRDWLWPLSRQHRTRHRPASSSLINNDAIKSAESESKSASASLASLANETLATNNQHSNENANHHFAYHFEWARRNELKLNSDSYGFVLSGQEIDASYRVFNELYLISANQLITINYTLANETVTSTHPIGDEFLGLSSSLLDPITGAYYDRATNQIYFFKGDRYVGYDYATKKPLEDFQLAPTTPTSTMMMMTLFNQQQQQPLVMSLPVVGILGRQHQVDGIYHDLHTDLVYIFTGMKFYTFRADEFKEGAFRNERGQPPMFCINEQLLDGCQFDAAFPNPCKTTTTAEVRLEGNLEADHGEDLSSHSDDDDSTSVGAKLANVPPAKHQQQGGRLVESNGSSSSAGLETAFENDNAEQFSREQQSKLRSIAVRGGGLLDYLVENTILNRGAVVARGAVEPILTTTADMMLADHHQLHSSSSVAHERIVICLLIAMVAITVLVTIAMIMVIINWSSRGANQSSSAPSEFKLPGELDSNKKQSGVETTDDYALQQYQNELTSRQQQVFHRPPTTTRGHQQNNWNGSYQQQFAPQRFHQQQSYLARQLIGDSLPPQPSPPVNSVFVLPPVKQHRPHRSSSASSTARHNNAAKIDSSAL